MYLVLDTETGGRNTNASLLEIYLKFYNADFTPYKTDDILSNDLHLLVKPNDHLFIVDGEAMEVNKINLVDHDKKSNTYEVAGQKLANWINRHRRSTFSESYYDYKATPDLYVLGHNVHFDLDFIYKYLMPKEIWDKEVSYRVRDTQLLGGSLRDAGLMPVHVAKLRAMSEHFMGKEWTKQHTEHTAKGDCEMTIIVYQKMMELLRGKK